MQQVHINRLGVNSIEFESDTVEMPLSPGEERSFELVMINYGAPTHVNISVSETIAENVTVLEDNPYVRHEEYIPLIVRIPYDGRLYTKGTIFITVGYGSHKKGFNVNIGMPGPNEATFSVDVDQSLSSPSKSKSYDSYNEDKWSTQLPEISLQMLVSAFETAASRSGHLIVSIIVVLFVLALVFFLRSLDLSSLFGFYPAVFLAIALTGFMAYLLTKLPIFK